MSTHAEQQVKRGHRTPYCRVGQSEVKLANRPDLRLQISTGAVPERLGLPSIAIITDKKRAITENIREGLVAKKRTKEECSQYQATEDFLVQLVGVLRARCSPILGTANCSKRPIRKGLAP
jgi:hypothetical protein